MTVYTSNKGWTLPTPSGSSGTWGTILNNNAFAAIDANLGAATSKTLSNSNVTLSAEETEALSLYFDGTLTGNVIITLTPETGSGITYAQGFWLVYNNTSGAYTVTITNGGSHTQAVPQGRHAIVYSTGSGGVYIAATDNAIPSGAQTLFFNSTAPLGWTKVTTYNDYALRIVSGTPSTGGTIAFSSLFNANITNVAQHNHGVTDPGHSHVYSIRTGSNGYSDDAPFYGTTTNNNTNTTTSTTGITINNSGSGSSTTFAVKYVDAIICQKD